MRHVLPWAQCGRLPAEEDEAASRALDLPAQERFEWRAALRAVFERDRRVFELGVFDGHYPVLWFHAATAFFELAQSQCCPIGHLVPAEVQRTLHAMSAIAGLLTSRLKSGTPVHSNSQGDPQNGHGFRLALARVTSSSVGTALVMA